MLTFPQSQKTRLWNALGIFRVSHGEWGGIDILRTKTAKICDLLMRITRGAIKPEIVDIKNFVTIFDGLTHIPNPTKSADD
jgi:hypothetical protein